jgi:hypothetical protein
VFTVQGGMRLDRWRVFDRRYSLGKLTKVWFVVRG